MRLVNGVTLKVSFVHVYLYLPSAAVLCSMLICGLFVTATVKLTLLFDLNMAQAVERYQTP